MKRFYIIIICQILVLILFLSAHFLLGFYNMSQKYFYLVWCDISFFTAIFLQILSILLLISLKVSDN